MIDNYFDDTDFDPENDGIAGLDYPTYDEHEGATEYTEDEKSDWQYEYEMYCEEDDDVPF